MGTQTNTQQKFSDPASAAPANTHLLQRKCACGGHAGLSGSCPSCSKKNLVAKPSLIQAKLTVNEPGDKFEQEADRVADAVMRMEEPEGIQRQPEEEEEEEALQAKHIQRQPEDEEEEEALQAKHIQRQPEDEEEEEALQAKHIRRQPMEEEEMMQPKRASSFGRSVGEATSQQITKLRGRGTPLDRQTRGSMESRFGHSFSNVRVHTGPEAANAASNVSARAFTMGSDIVFGSGQFAPDSPGGQQLLAHELTHTIQQGAVQKNGAGASRVAETASPQVQRGIFGDIWEGIKSVGRAIGNAVSSAANWIGERLHDAAQWVINLVKDLPARLARLATTLWEGLSGIVTFIPEAIQALASGGLKGLASWLWEKAKRGGAWILKLVSRVFDVIGGPEIVEFIWHILTKARPLRGDEIAAASQVLGASAIRWGDVRVAEGGLLDLIFALNNKRAFVMFHTVNLPSGETTDTVVHELTHVFQYEKVGTIYLGEAIHAQATRGSDAYNYGGPDGLVSGQKSGRAFSSFNREEQAQIAQDYYKYVILGEITLTDEQRQAYEYYITQLRAGQV